ncbi:TBC1 domain family member 7 isoform X1 [Homalodisca vitripennis]|uniref:TBC1 domain family member 7 isoform X1 n=1 Tax=Homalodisca vitripennis TaxID=197043 RepID=UPI001EEA12D1|nr:TBC1 domain family member 7 isoform X1 [Homalodisca vitripennis]
MSDERNFRSFYYERVGCRSVEEKKSLEILFRDKAWDKIKIKQFCSRFSVPLVYRCSVWKFILGVIPSQKKCHEFIMEERKSQYLDLLECLKAMKYVTHDSPKEQKFLEMWLLEKYNLAFDRNEQLKLEFHQNLLAITRTLVGTFEDDVDVYWIAKGLFEYVKTWCSSIPQLIETTKTVLKKEDSLLYNHLEECKLMNVIPFNTWFGRCFSGVLHDAALVKVWDKMIGGSYRVLIFTCTVLLITMRRVLLTCVNYTQFITCVQSVNNETSEVIVSKSLELWSIHGRSVMSSPIKEYKPAPTTNYRRKSFSRH